MEKKKKPWIKYANIQEPSNFVIEPEEASTCINKIVCIISLVC